MIEGTTKSGFSFSIQEENLDNWDLFDALALADEGHAEKLRVAGHILLGKDQFKKFVDHLRDENGKAKTTDVIRELIEIFTLSGDAGKNS